MTFVRREIPVHSVTQLIVTQWVGCEFRKWKKGMAF